MAARHGTVLGQLSITLAVIIGVRPLAGKKARRPTRGRSWHGPASARRPSRLGTSKTHGVTRRAFARLTCSAPRDALASARGPWPCSLTTGPLCGLAESPLRFVCSVNLRHEVRRAVAGSRRANDNRSTIGPQSFGTSCARLTCRSPGTAALGVSIVNGRLAVPDKTP